MNPDQTNGLEDIPSFGDPEGEALIDAKYSAQREARIDQAYAAYEDARRDMAALDRTRADVEARRRIPIEDVSLSGFAVQQALQQAANPPQAQSSVAIEDAAKGDPRVTTKLYVGSPLTQADLDAALEAHAYVHRMAAEMAMSNWQHTVEMLQELHDK